MAPKKPCVLFLLDWRPMFWSTREEYFWRLSQRLVARGVTPVIVVSDEVEPRVRERFEKAGARLTSCSYHARPGEYRTLIQSVTREFRVLFAQVRYFDYFTALFWMCRTSGISRVVFTEANGGEWRQKGWKATLLRMRTKVMCAPVGHFIAISEFIRRRLEAVGVASDKIAVVYNGIDLAFFQPDEGARAELRQELGTNPTAVVLIFMSAFVELKRPEIPLDVCAELKRRGVEFELWMLGKGPLRETLEAQATKLGIAGQVRWLGHQPDPHRWLASADVFLHTTMGEAFGNVLVEAQACGLPVIASNAGAAPELIEEDRTGKLVPVDAHEVEKLACAVQYVTEDPDRYAALSRQAMESARRFTLETSVDNTFRVYEKWLNPAAR